MITQTRNSAQPPVRPSEQRADPDPDAEDGPILVQADSLGATMESPSDTDWFKVDLVAGTTYTFTVTGLSNFSFLQITPAGSAVDIATPVESFAATITPAGITYTADTSGAYFLGVADEAGTTGPYTVAAAVVPDSFTLLNPGLLPVGGSLGATMESPSDTDWFKIDLVAGTTYTVTVTGLSNFTFLQTALAGSAVDIAIPVESFPGTITPAGITYTADTTGAYFLGVADEAGITGPYTVAAAVVPDSFTLLNPGLLPVGGSLGATMESPSDTDWFKVDLVAGTTYTFTVTGLSNFSFLQTAPAGSAVDIATPVESFPGTVTPAGITYTADTTGAYFLGVADEAGTTGPYTVAAAVVPDSFTLLNPGLLPVGGSLGATMESPSDTDWFKVDLVAGTTYTVTVTGLSNFTFLQTAPAGSAVDIAIPVESFAATITPVGITYTADTSGAYFLGVADEAGTTGPYTVAAAVVPDSFTLLNPGLLPVGGSLGATMESPSDTDWFKVDLVAGTTYTVTVTGLSNFSFLQIAPAGSAVDIATPVETFPGTVTPAGITYTADTSGAYFLGVADEAGTTGPYTVAAAVVPDSFTLLNPGLLAVGGGSGSSGSAVTVSDRTYSISAGQTDTGDTVLAGGIIDVLLGGIALGTTVDTGGIQVVFGSAVGTVISSTGANYVESGGAASGTVIFSGGDEFVEAGGTAIGTVVDGGNQVVYGAAGGTVVNSGAYLYLESGTATDTVVSSGVALVVGTARGTTDGAGGFDFVASGGSAVGTTLSGGDEYVEMGGTASGTTVDAGAQVVYGTALGTVLNTGTSAYFEAGSIASGLVVNGALAVLNGTVGGAAVTSTGYDYVEPGGTAINTILTGLPGGVGLSGGEEFVELGAVASGTVLDGGAQVVYGLTVGTVVDSGGYEYVYIGGSASGTVVDSGVESIFGGAVGTVVHSGGAEFVFLEGIASGTILAGGDEFIEVGSAVGTLVSGAGGDQVVYDTAVGAQLVSGGLQAVQAGGTASSTTVAAGGYQYVAAGGAAVGTTISGGIVELAGGAIAGAAPIVFASGGGLLKLDAAQSFSGTVAGFGLSDQIDLEDIAFGNTTTSAFQEAAGNASGTLTVADGAHTARLVLLGQFVAGQFHLASDGNGGTVVTAPQLAETAAPSTLIANQHA